MSIDLNLLGSKLRAYREQLQLTLAEVAGGTGIDESRLKLCEDGLVEPTGDEVLILADFYKCDYRVFVSNEEITAFEQMEKMFRRYGDDLSKSDRRAIQEFLFLCECEQQLEVSLRGSPPQPIEIPGRRARESHKDHGRRAAGELRRRLGYGARVLPIDVFKVFRQLGLHVFRRHLGNSGISGLYIHHPAIGKCILVNYEEDVFRQRFTVAHEVAHALLDEGESEFGISFSSWPSENLSEIRANNFAAEFLMPQEFLQQIPGSRIWDEEKILEWSSKLSVNPIALVISLRQAGLLTAVQADRFGRLKIPIDQKQDPELPPNLSARAKEVRIQLLKRGLSTPYVNLCFRAYEEGVISSGRLAEMLLVDERGLEEIVKLFVGNRRLRYGY